MPRFKNTFFKPRCVQCPSIIGTAEDRYFDFDGLMCINLDCEQASEHRWRAAVVPCGIELARDASASSNHAGFGLPEQRSVVVMESTLIETKRVVGDVRNVAPIEKIKVVAASDGPIRRILSPLADDILRRRFAPLMLSAARMPGLYRPADSFVYKSLRGSFSNILVNAMASGLLIVGYLNARWCWFVRERDTQLCHTEDREVNTVTLWLDLERSQGKAASRVAQFNGPAIALQYFAFAREILSA